MIHEIEPKKYDVQFKEYKPTSGDTVILFVENKVCYKIEDGLAKLPKLSQPELKGLLEKDGEVLIYMFSIDNERFFLVNPNSDLSLKVPEGYEANEYGIFRDVGPRDIAFAIVTAQHLHLWYLDKKFCGRCGSENSPFAKERALVCKNCGQIEYPKISPCVIVAVSHGDKLLLTRYKDRPYNRYALIAGFVEIGESLEQCVAREVFEETGVCVKNIRYYKSQPWGFTSTLLMGCYCELEGDPTITVDYDELSEAVWVSREDIPPAISDIALTAEMMEMFRLGKQ